MKDQKLKLIVIVEKNRLRNKRRSTGFWKMRKDLEGMLDSLLNNSRYTN